MKETRLTTHLSADSSIFRACVEGSNDAIMLTDVGGKILYVNLAWEVVYGYRKEEAVGQTPRLLRSGRHDGGFYSRLWAEILDPEKRFWRGEVINRTKDGRELPVQLTISPFDDAEGVTQGYMSIATDLSERKRFEAQLRAQDRLATVGLLTEGLAHEIGTPLGIARGRAEYLFGETTAGSTLGESLRIIVAQIDRVSKLISTLLGVTREQGTGDVIPVDLPHAIDAAAMLVRGRLAESDAVVDIQVPSTARVLAEPTRLRQVLLNLGLNAAQAIEAARAAGRKGPHVVTMAAEDRGDCWEISIRDTGCGIAPESFPRLFTPFFTTKAVGTGTGLGLVVAQQYVSGWGGAIWADGPASQGACFRVRLSKPWEPGVE